MAAAGADQELGCFRQTTGGWVFRAPNPWIFGDAPHYLVNDAQKARITALLTPRRPVLLGLYYAAAMIAWVFAVSGLAWAMGLDADQATPGEFAGMVVLFVAPVIATLPLIAVIQGRRLRPLLAGVPRTNERISLGQMRQTMADTMPAGRSLKFGCLWTLIAAAQIVNLALRNARHPLFSDGLSYVLIVAAAAAAIAAAGYFLRAMRKRPINPGTG